MKKLAAALRAVSVFFCLFVAGLAHGATFVQLSGEPGDYILDGKQRHLTPNDAAFRVSSPSASVVSIAVENFAVPFSWYLDFNANGSPLTVGSFERVRRHPVMPAGHPGLNVDGEGHGCNLVTGRFVVREIARAQDGTVSRFAADFVQHCGGATRALFGGVRINSDVPYSQLSSDLTGATFIDAHLRAIAGRFDVANGSFLVTPFSNGVYVNMNSIPTEQVWRLGLGNVPGHALAPGTYENATKLTLQQPGPGIDIQVGGIDCREVAGRFVVRELVVDDDGVILRYAADFSGTCDPEGPFAGGVRYQSEVPFTHIPITGVATRLVADPAKLQLRQGERAVLAARVVDEVGAPIANANLFFDGDCLESNSRLVVSDSDGYARTAVVGRDKPCTVLATLTNSSPPLSTRFDIAVYGSVEAPAFTTSLGDMWWTDNENGWGMSFIQHGDRLFNVIYAYDAVGKPTWFVMPNGSWDGSHTKFSGSLYLPRGTPFSSYDASRFVPGAPVGWADITFGDGSNALFEYSINDMSGRKSVSRMQFGSGGAAAVRGGDMWWGGASQNGWGISIVQQQSTLFTVWYTYGADGFPTWFVMPGGQWSAGNVYEGAIFSTTSSRWVGATYDPSALRVNEVGTYRFTFTAVGGQFDYTLDGRTATLALERQLF